MSESANNTSSSQVPTNSTSPTSNQPVSNNAQSFTYNIPDNQNVSISTVQTPAVSQPGVQGQQVVMQPVVQGQPIMMQPMFQQVGQPMIIQQPGQPLIIQQTGQPMQQAVQPIYIQPGQQVMIQQGQPIIYQTPTSPPPSYQQITVQENNNSQTVYKVDESKIPEHSANIYCPYCKKSVKTYIQYEDNIIVWGLCFALFCFTVFLFWLPFIFNQLKDAVHYCPYCRNEVGRKRRVN